MLSPMARWVRLFQPRTCHLGPTLTKCVAGCRMCVQGGGSSFCGPITWPRWEPEEPSILGLKIIQVDSLLEHRRESRQK